MSFTLQTGAPISRDITSRELVGNAIASADGVILVDVRLFDLDPSAATIDIDVTVTPNGGNEEQASFFSDTKRTDADTAFRRYPAFALSVNSGDDVRVWAKSSNPNDSNITSQSTFRDGLFADVGRLDGDATAAMNLEADYDGTGYNKSNSTIGTTTANTDMRGTDEALTSGDAPIDVNTTHLAGNAVQHDGAGTIKAQVTSLTTAALNAIKDKLLPFYRLFLRSDSAIKSDHSTQLGEINADQGSGDGDYDSETDALEGVKDTQLQKGEQYRWTNSDGDSKDVTADDVP